MVDFLLDLLTLLGILIVGSILLVTAFVIVCVVAYLVHVAVVGIKSLFKKNNRK